MNLYTPDDLSPGTLVVFYTRCTDCNKTILDCEEFYWGLDDTHKELYAKHTEETGHEKFTLESLVRKFICAECGFEWLYKEEIVDWQRKHYQATQHSYYGFSSIIKKDYETNSFNPK